MFAMWKIKTFFVVEVVHVWRRISKCTFIHVFGYNYMLDWIFGYFVK